MSSKPALTPEAPRKRVRRQLSPTIVLSDADELPSPLDRTPKTKATASRNSEAAEAAEAASPILASPKSEHA